MKNKQNATDNVFIVSIGYVKNLLSTQFNSVSVEMSLLTLLTVVRL